MGGCREGNLNSGVRSVHILVQMCFNDAIVVEADPFTEGVLGDFEAAIDITAERRGEIEADGESERFRSEPMRQGLFVRGLGQGQPELLADMLLVGPACRRQHPAALDRGVLMIDAGGYRQRDLDGFGGDDCRRRRDMKRCPGT